MRSFECPAKKSVRVNYALPNKSGTAEHRDRVFSRPSRDCPAPLRLPTVVLGYIQTSLRD
jgi:hypothetical protein